MSRHKVTDQGQDGHHDVFSDRHDIGASHFGNSDTTIGLVGRIQVDVIRANTGRDGKLQVLCLGQALRSEVARVETVAGYLATSLAWNSEAHGKKSLTVL